jgi:hypothetical protein
VGFVGVFVRPEGSGTYSFTYNGTGAERDRILKTIEIAKRDPIAALARAEGEKNEAIASARLAWKIAFVELGLILVLAFACLYLLETR